jgi:hypothetical protein
MENWKLVQQDKEKQKKWQLAPKHSEYFSIKLTFHHFEKLRRKGIHIK